MLNEPEAKGMETVYTDNAGERAEVRELLQNMVVKYNKSLIIITHNLGLVTRYAERVYVMYAGKIVEYGTTEQLLTQSIRTRWDCLNRCRNWNLTRMKNLFRLRAHRPYSASSRVIVRLRRAVRNARKTAERRNIRAWWRLNRVISWLATE